MSQQLPEIFIGSSSEGEAVARWIEVHLHPHANVTIWKNGVFKPGVSYLQSLLNALDNFDFAVLVLTPDDVVESRDDSYSSPRDNVIFELGLFMGRLGAKRAFFVAEEDKSLKLPSDLDGISRLNYRVRENMEAAVSPACTTLISEIRKQGRLSREKPAVAPDSQDSRNILNEPLSAEENEVRTLAREFFRADHEGRQKAVEEITQLAPLVPLGRILLLSDSALPGERVAAALGLAAHIKKDASKATRRDVKSAIIRGLDDSRSRVRFRYVELIANVPHLIMSFRPMLREVVSDDSNEAVRQMAAKALSNDPDKRALRW